MSCPLLSPASTSLGNATIFYSCILLNHDGGLTSDVLHGIIEREDAIPQMTTPGDAALTTAVASSHVTQNIINILGKIDQVGKVITEVS
jgi:hypothetical protein